MPGAAVVQALFARLLSHVAVLVEDSEGISALEYAPLTGGAPGLGDDGKLVVELKNLAHVMLMTKADRPVRDLPAAASTGSCKLASVGAQQLTRKSPSTRAAAARPPPVRRARLCDAGGRAAPGF